MDEEWRVWGVLGWRLVNLAFEGGRSPVGYLVSGGVITVALTPLELELRLWHLILSGEKKDPYFHLAHRAWSHRFDPELGLRVEWRDPQQPSDQTRGRLSSPPPSSRVAMARTGRNRRRLKPLPGRGSRGSRHSTPPPSRH
jgi:hypothetical protein